MKKMVVVVVIAVVLLGVLWALAAPSIAEVVDAVFPAVDGGKVVPCPVKDGGGVDDVLNSWKSDLGKTQIRLNTPTAASCRKTFLAFTKSGDASALGAGKCTERVVQKVFCINGRSKKPAGFTQEQLEAFCTWVAQQ